MKRFVVLLAMLVALSLALPGCSRERPGADGGPTLEPDGGYPDQIDDRRPMVRELTALRLEQTPAGVIVHAEALPETQGYWAPGLVNVSGIPDAESETPDVVSFEFRAEPPVTPQPVGSAQSRALSAAAFLSNAELAGIRTITVAASTNTRSLRR